MSVKVFATQEVQDLLRAAANIGSDSGNARAKEITQRLLSDLFKAIEDLDMTPDEIWAGVNYFNKLGQDGEAALLAAGLGLEKYLDIRMDAADRQAEIEGGTPRTIEGPLYVEGAPVRDHMSKIDLDADADAGPLVIRGTVRGPDGKPVAGAVVECWHANSKGFYSHFDPTGAQSEFNLRGAVRTGEDGTYEFRTLMPVGYGCPPHGATQQLLNMLARHGNRPAHVHFFVTANGLRKLTTQINIEGDPLIWDDFAYATREDLIPHVVEKTGGAALGLKADAYKEIEFDIALTGFVKGRDNQVVNRLRASAVI
ncbi:catechol 1,2-dioxygenase [bacterium M00.F.Ca.ET.228.01.1.1]|uniref:catechol 1,2-dioxygenase n=1 Tax=Paraburkholderia phenoliruptrix TaxID=252970 RepID=UPI0010932648|nr:catechol 1,2-dioxygenase [Paraburkholderia phenoliruptrix]TGP46114.1 catechol 1,2-dioxygenase [bacterium M00.F.Ca.ET.228.01.1.1]TGS03973.1 catechol 1,2-dioxygenase [bacterium M00.F.Ca.ET.191.01.1.1]TGU07407.1 catechol 1,2-dioxygenase [bacterium M00.F.Ca.ET.155.01.1.1]MBW0446658.1 catechol 1,2-dioxygenase [Paraburkholderia phenoliruptrix]MBW9096915.1 catechol 1,2-dioxygenase [Paraburkholderia phenoliruptrix]